MSVGAVFQTVGGVELNDFCCRPAVASIANIIPRAHQALESLAFG